MGLFLFLIPSPFRNSNWGTILLIIVAGLVYLLALYLFRGIKKDDLKTILNKKDNSLINV